MKRLSSESDSIRQLLLTHGKQLISASMHTRVSYATALVAVTVVLASYGSAAAARGAAR